MNELALFAGAGGGILGGQLLGWRTVCAVERDAYAAQVLAQRQNDRCIETFPIWSDVCSFDGNPWQGIVDIISGGFPCQDISIAGAGKGIDGERSGLWREMARIIGEVRPQFVLVENSPMLIRRGLAVVIGDLTRMGYDTEWCRISASDCGAPHQRDRFWLLAHTNSAWKLQQAKARNEFGHRASYRRETLADSDSKHGERVKCGNAHAEGREIKSKRPTRSQNFSRRRWPDEPAVGRVAHGVAHRVDQLRARGNGQVPRVAAAAFDLLSN